MMGRSYEETVALLTKSLKEPLRVLARSLNTGDKEDKEEAGETGETGGNAQHLQVSKIERQESQYQLS